MKKLLILAATTVIFASCTKEYVCECNDSISEEKSEMTYWTNQKSHARRLCEDWASRQRSVFPDKDKLTCTIK